MCPTPQYEHTNRFCKLATINFFPSERFLQPNRNDFFIDFAKCWGTRVINIKNMWKKPTTEMFWEIKVNENRERLGRQNIACFKVTNRKLKWHSKLDDFGAEKKAISICHFRFHLGHVLWLLQNWDFFLFRWHFWWNFCREI